VEHFQDVPHCIQEVALYGVCFGVANTLEVAQLHHGVLLSESLTPSFVEEHNNKDVEELVEDFTPCTDAIAQVTLAERHSCSCLRR
jgi:hypothetical protein